MKKIIALLLCAIMLFSLVSCVRKSDVNSDETTDVRDNAENIEKETKQNFLVMGHDRTASLTDVIMLVSFDTESGELCVMQIPRDTYYEVEDYYYHKMNGLYNYYIGAEKEEETKDYEMAALRDTADYLQKALDIKIHHCAVMDLDGFGDIVDAIGGVYMYIPYSMKYNDPDQNLYINLPEGYCNMTGKQAEQFVRYRSGFVTADLGRGDAQKMFMIAFLDSLKKNISIKNIGDIASSVLSSTITDLSLGDIVSLGKAALKIDLENVTMLTLPGESKTCSGTSYYVMNRENSIKAVQEHFNIYKTLIDDTTFDADRVFCNDSDSAMTDVYYKSGEELSYKEHNGQDVYENDIDIPLK